MENPDGAPAAPAQETPNAAPAGSPGHAPSPPASPTPGGDTLPQPSPGFDAQAYLSTLPEDERAAKAGLPAHILERDSKRQMRRSDYDRKRGEESATVKALQKQNELLRQHADRLTELAAAGQGGDPPPTPDDLAKRVYDADSPEEYAAGLGELIEAKVGQAVSGALAQDPTIRRISAGVALREVRADAPSEDFTDADFQEAHRALEEDLAARGARIDQLSGEALKALYAPRVEIARLRRVLASKDGAAETRPTTPAPPAATVPTLPVSGAGASPVSASPGPAETHGPDVPTKQKVDATLSRHGLTRDDLRAAMKNF